MWCFWQAMFFLQNNPQFTVLGLRSRLPEGQFSALIKARRFLRRHSWVVLALWAVAESCWKTRSSPLKRFVLRGFTTPCSMSSWYTQAPFLPLSRKNEEVSPPDGTPPTILWRRKCDGHPAPSELTSRDIWAEILLFWLLYFSVVKIFSSVKRMFSGPFLACHWRRRSALVRWISFKAGVRRCPFEWKCALSCGDRRWWSTTWLGRHVKLSEHDLLFPEWFSANPLPYCFDSSFSPHTFQASRLSTVCNPPEFLIMFNCLIDEHSWNFQWF